MKTSFASKKDAIRFCVIDGAYLINVMTQMACDGCTVFAHILHFFKDCSPVFMGQGQKEISYWSRSALSMIVAPLPLMTCLLTTHPIPPLELYHI